MERKSRISLDDPAFRGRILAPRSTVRYERPHAMGGFNDLKATPKITQAKPTPSLTNPITVTKKPKTLAAAKTRHHLPKQTRSHVLKRQMVKSVSPKYRPKHRRPLMPTLLSGMAIVLFMVGLLAAFSTIRTEQSVKAQVKGLAKQTDEESDGTPSEEEPPSNLSSYSVAPDLPRILEIEKINLSARVRRLGVNSNNVLKAPSNIFDVGWYDASAKPGENGTVVLDGHVSGPTKRGVFHSIGSLKAGDKISLERGDGKKFTYTVTGTQVYGHDKVDMPKVLTSSVVGKPGLNLITCTGRFNVRTNNYEQRVVVFSVQD